MRETRDALLAAALSQARELERSQARLLAHVEATFREQRERLSDLIAGLARAASLHADPAPALVPVRADVERLQADVITLQQCLREKDLLIRRLQGKRPAPDPAPDNTRDLATYETELVAYHRQIDAERRELDAQLARLKARKARLDEERSRAEQEVARFRSTLDDLRDQTRVDSAFVDADIRPSSTPTIQVEDEEDAER